MLELGEAGLIEHIKTIGLFNSKARHVMKLSAILVEDFGGEVPSSRAALQSLPGVGRKTANVVLNTWWKLPAMAVDTHIFRVANRTGIARGKDVVAVERALEDNVPAPYQLHAHHWLILHGRYTCVARKPDCRDLPDPRPLPLRGEDPLTKAYQVVGIGNALVDVIAHVEDGFLDRRTASRRASCS